MKWVIVIFFMSLDINRVYIKDGKGFYNRINIIIGDYNVRKVKVLNLLSL